MAKQFEDQGGAATMDPSSLLRWITSKVMTRISSEKGLLKNRKKFEEKRLKKGQAHVVEYFHQLEDGYSHLVAQVLESFSARYDIVLVCHLVTGPQGRNSAEPELLLKLSGYDAFHVAPSYGLEFPEHQELPDEQLVSLSASILAAQDSKGFIGCVADVGRALWASDAGALEALAGLHGIVSEHEVQAKIKAGTQRREALKHYSGAMFYYGEEWYWGVDRLYHLEKRLAQLGADSQATNNSLVPRPATNAVTLKDNGRLTLEFYPSLRSPYTAIVFDRTVKLAADTGVNFVVRPVLPMVMRGVPATRQKGMYIFLDASREAREAGVPYGNFYDPIGEPVRRCYSMYSWACEQGKGTALLSCFLNAAFVQGIDTSRDKGLKIVVEKAGLNWVQAQSVLGQPGWEEGIESNRLAMYEAGLWGVPSFRLLDENGQQLLALWGQDRLWLFAREIQRQLTMRQ